MTAKRDLKTRIRERQARTGESYVTARRHVMSQAPAPVAAPASAMDVVELQDHSDDASRLGLRCRVMMSPRLIEYAEPATVIARLRDALVGTADDPSTAFLREIALSGNRPFRPRRRRSFEATRRFFRRARAGLGGTTEDGSMLALPVAGHDGIVSVLCTAWHNDPSLVLSTFEELDSESFDIGAANEPAPTAEKTLFMIFNGRRHAIKKSLFVIGRTKSCDLQIKDGMISRKHVGVIRRADVFYIKDLGSIAGLVYRGMKIDNKRIDEGDEFQLGEYVLRFTYLARE